MSFGSIIKKLRRERDLTQEGLAQTLNISPQAVSRWENDAAMPDISMLPILCNYFEVSADMLLGIDVAKKRQKINTLLSEAEKYSFRGYYEEAREILRGGLREYPDCYEIMYNLMYVSFWQHNSDEKETVYCNEAIRLGESILEKCTHDGLRHGAIQILCSCYRDIGNIKAAVKLANNMPFIKNSREMLLSEIYSGDKGYRAKQKEANNLLRFLAYRLDFMQDKSDSGEDFYTEDELAVLREKQIALVNLFFEDGNFGFYHTMLGIAYFRQAKYYYAKFGDSEKALDCIRASAEHAIRFITSAEDEKYTSLVFRGMPRGDWCGGDTDNDAARLLKMLDDAVFDGIRDMPEFIEITEKLKQYADKWQVK